MKMQYLPYIFAVISGLIHVLFFFVESIWFMRKKFYKRFLMSEADALVTKDLFFNQGFYNLFLAIMNFVGVYVSIRYYAFIGYPFLLCGSGAMVGAGMVLFFTSKEMRVAALIQGLPPLVTFVYLILKII
jgi:putative membrane protein